MSTEAVHHLGTNIVFGSQTEVNLSRAGVPSPFHDPIHKCQRSEFTQLQTQPSKCCLLTLLHSDVNMLQVTEPSVLSVLQNTGLGPAGEAAACSPVVVVVVVALSGPLVG